MPVSSENEQKYLSGTLHRVLDLRIDTTTSFARHFNGRLHYLAKSIGIP